MQKCCHLGALLIAATLFGTGLDAAAGAEAAAAAISRTIAPPGAAGPQAGQSPFRICILDFSTADIQGQKRFLDGKNKPIAIPASCTLNDADRQSVHAVMQGFVRMIDAWDTARTHDANRAAQQDDNVFSRARALNLYHTVVQGESRPVVLGAEYLAGYLGRHNDVFNCIPAPVMENAMEKLRQTPDFPQNFMLQLARATGATHLIYGTVSDLRSQDQSFQGYGIATLNTVYQLDVLLKVVDLPAQRVVYSNVYTGTCREQQLPNSGRHDNHIFQTLMNAALEQAAEDLYERCNPKLAANAIQVTPPPCLLTVNPTGGSFFKAADAEVFADGIRIGKGNVSFLIAPGRHKLEIRAPGHPSKTIELDVAGDETIQAVLEK